MLYIIWCINDVINDVINHLIFTPPPGRRYYYHNFTVEKAEAKITYHDKGDNKYESWDSSQFCPHSCSLPCISLTKQGVESQNRGAKPKELPCPEGLKHIKENWCAWPPFRFVEIHQRSNWKNLWWQKVRPIFYLFVRKGEKATSSVIWIFMNLPMLSTEHNQVTFSNDSTSLSQRSPWQRNSAPATSPTLPRELKGRADESCAMDTG